MAIFAAKDPDMQARSKAIWFVTFMICLAAFSRFLPHPPNFAPIGALALFGAAYIRPRWIGFLIPLAAMWLSDLILNNVVHAAYYDGFQWIGSPLVYLAFGLVFLTGSGILQRVSVPRVLTAALSSSVIFFLISNLDAWIKLGFYPKTAAGLVECYIAAIPFYWYSLAGDLVYCAVLFGSYAYFGRRFVVAARQTA